jgi:hypothetical protein
MDLKNRLCDVETNRRDSLHGPVLRIRSPPWRPRSVSRGSPTFTDSSRAMSLRFGGDRKPFLAARSRCGPAAGCSLTAVCRTERLGDVEVAIGAVRNHRLTGLKMELGAVEMYRDDVRLERH